MRSLFCALSWLGFGTLAACASSSHRSGDAPRAPRMVERGVDAGGPNSVRSRSAVSRESSVACRYEVGSGSDAVLEVTVDCESTVRRLVALEPLLIPHVSFSTTDSTAVDDAGRWILPEVSPSTPVRYRVDLSALAEETHHHDLALRVGSAVVAPLRSFILVPDPPESSGLVVTGGDGVVLASDGTSGGLELPAGEVDRTGEYAVVGSMSPRTLQADVAGGSVQVTLVALGSTPPIAALETWVRQALRATATVYGEPPTARTLLIVVGLERPGTCLNGSALGASAVVLLGEQANEAELLRSPVLIEELFHQGLPRFESSGDWLIEGMATYYSWLALYRIGAADDARLWTMLGAGLDRAVTQPRWRGVLACLEADRLAREATDGRFGLEDAIVALRASDRFAARSADFSSLVETLENQLVSLAGIEPNLRSFDLQSVDRNLNAIGFVRRTHGGALTGTGLPLRQTLARPSQPPEK